MPELENFPTKQTFQPVSPFLGLTDIYEYWIGKNIQYADVWESYEKGRDYIAKYESMKVHLFQITFEQQPKELPLFNFEAVYKTLKGCFHDLKLYCFDQQTYNESGPLFIYSVERGSGIWEFVGELRQIVFFGSTLSDQKLMGETISNIDRKISLLQKYFGTSIKPEDYYKFMKAKTPRQVEKAFEKLFEQNIQSIKISQIPFTGNMEEAKASLIELKPLLNAADEDNSESAS